MTVTHPMLAPLGLLIAGVVVVDAGIGAVGFGTAGWPLLLAVTSTVYLAAAALFLLWRNAPDWLPPLSLAGMAGAVVAMHVLDPQGPVIGLMLLAALAPLGRHRAVATALTVATAVAFNATQLLAAGESVVLTVATDAGVLFFYLLGTLLRGEQRERARADRLLLELEASREAERAAVAEAARARMARELHDVLAHTLSGLTIQLQAARLLASQRAVDAELASVIDRAQQLAKSGMAEARRAVGALRGEHLPGADALAQLVAEHRLATGGEVTLTVGGSPVRLHPEADLTLYRTAQEALTNARKHAPGSRVQVWIDWDDVEVTLTVRNEAGPSAARPTGTGPTAAAMPAGTGGGGYGLTGMAERARLVGALLTAGPSEHGFEVRLAIPLRSAAEPA